MLEVAATKQAECPSSINESGSAVSTEPQPSFLVQLGSSLPTALVVAALVGVAALGHYTGWTMPKFASLTGNGSADKDDWCGEHAVPESLCVECNPGLLPRGKAFGWCKKHGVQECPLCHPEIAQLPNPSVTPAEHERTNQALGF